MHHFLCLCMLCSAPLACAMAHRGTAIVPIDAPLVTVNTDALAQLIAQKHMQVKGATTSAADSATSALSSSLAQLFKNQDTLNSFVTSLQAKTGAAGEAASTAIASASTAAADAQKLVTQATDLITHVDPAAVSSLVTSFLADQTSQLTASATQLTADKAASDATTKKWKIITGVVTPLVTAIAALVTYYTKCNCVPTT